MIPLLHLQDIRKGAALSDAPFYFCTSKDAAGKHARHVSPSHTFAPLTKTDLIPREVSAVKEGGSIDHAVGVKQPRSAFIPS